VDLLQASVLSGKKRYATDGERAFAGEEHATGVWHGWPVGWMEVDEKVRNTWVDEGRVKRSSVQRHWQKHQEAR